MAFGPSMVKTSVNERAMISKLNVFFLLVNCQTLMIVNKFPREDQERKHKQDDYYYHANL